MARVVQLYLVGEHHIDDFWGVNLKDLISGNLSNYFHIDGYMILVVVWVIICYTLWYWRNKRKSDENFGMPINLSLLINNRVQEYFVSEPLNLNIFEKSQEMKNIKWHPPPQSWICINVDGVTPPFFYQIFYYILIV